MSAHFSVSVGIRNSRTVEPILRAVLMQESGSVPDTTHTFLTLDGTEQTTEANAQGNLPRVSVITAIEVRLSAALTGTQTLIVTLRRNGIDTGLAVSFSSATAQQLIATGSENFALTDAINFVCAFGGGLLSAVVRAVCIEYQ